MEELLLSTLLGGRKEAPAETAPPRPPGGPWTKFGAFWLAVDGRGTPEDDAKYIVTPTVAARLQQLARMVAARRHPVLLQGPTSAGKTSMVERLAKATGHRLIRINNHEHTDVSEYIGTFTPDADGRLVFVDGARLFRPSELQDMEDHEELDPLLRAAITRCCATRA